MNRGSIHKIQKIGFPCRDASMELRVGKSRKRKRRGAINKTDGKDDLVFKALSNADRRRILDLVREAPRTTGDICEAIPGLDRCTVMLHIKSLEAADLLLTKKRGRFRWNYLNVEPIQRVYNRWIKDYAQGAAELLTDLKKQLEDEHG